MSEAFIRIGSALESIGVTFMVAAFGFFVLGLAIAVAFLCIGYLWQKVDDLSRQISQDRR